MGQAKEIWEDSVSRCDIYIYIYILDLICTHTHIYIYYIYLHGSQKLNSWVLAMLPYHWIGWSGASPGRPTFQAQHGLPTASSVAWAGGCARLWFFCWENSEQSNDAWSLMSVNGWRVSHFFKAMTWPEPTREADERSTGKKAPVFAWKWATPQSNGTITIFPHCHSFSLSELPFLSIFNF